MSLYFEQHQETGVQFLNELAKELGQVENLEKAGRVTKSILDAMRDMMYVDDALEFLNLLPPFLRPIFVDGWYIREDHEVVYSLENFVARIMQEDGRYAEKDFFSEEYTISGTKDFFRVLGKYLTEEERLDIQGILPEPIGKLWEEAVLV